MNNKNNIVIAEFMGITIFSNLRYDSSWNCLMTVIEKIGNINFSEDKELENKINNIFPSNINQLFTNREYIYGKVVMFIKWYNLRNQSKSIITRM